MKQKIVISTNKLLYDLFNFTFDDDDIKETQNYVDGKWETVYYVDFKYESSKNSSFKVRLSSLDKDKLRFTIYEKMLFLILISNARQSSDDNYFISMRKIKQIRGLANSSASTYNCYEMALDRLKSKTIRVLPQTIHLNYQIKIINCSLLTISNVSYSGSRIAAFNYSFNGLSTSLVKNNQKYITNYNLFSFIFKKHYSFQICLHLMRLISLNKTSICESKEFSFLLMLKQLHVVNNSGFIEKRTYYEYVAMAGNKQAEILKKYFIELEIILKQLVKHKVIKNYCISKKKTYKYLRDDEVKIGIKFIK